MPGGFFDTGSLSNHNHTSVPGDGGVLSNLGVTGTVSGTGIVTGGTGVVATTGDVVSTAGNVKATIGVVNEGGTPALATDVITLQYAQMLSLLGAT